MQGTPSFNEHDGIGVWFQVDGGTQQGFFGQLFLHVGIIIDYTGGDGLVFIGEGATSVDHYGAGFVSIFITRC